MKLSRAQIRTLTTAAALVNRKGLQKGASGWVDPDAAFEVHSFNTVRSLVENGYLALYVSGTVAHATEAGIAKAQEIREALEQQRRGPVTEIRSDGANLLVADYGNGSIIFIHPLEADRHRGVKGCKVRKPTKADYERTEDSSRRFAAEMQAERRKD